MRVSGPWGRGEVACVGSLRAAWRRAATFTTSTRARTRSSGAWSPDSSATSASSRRAAAPARRTRSAAARASSPSAWRAPACGCAAATSPPRLSRRRGGAPRPPGSRSPTARRRSRRSSPQYDAAELVVCCEVLEHLPDPEAALATLAGLARPWLLVSVPREPLWRALNLARFQLRGRAREHPGAPRPLVEARPSRLPERAGRRRRGAQPAALDDGALPGGPLVSAARRMAAWVRARPGTLAIVCLGIAWGAVIHTTGWAQLAHFAEVRAIASGSKTIDRWHWETGDSPGSTATTTRSSRPGMAALSAPLYMLIDATGGRRAGRRCGGRSGEGRPAALDPERRPAVHVLWLRRRAGRARSAAGRGRDPGRLGR